MIQAVLGISHINWYYVKGVYNKKIGGSGRSIKEKDLIEETDITKVTFGNLYTKWHLHILVLSSPSETLAREIKSYIDKNWGIAVSYRKFKNGKVYAIDTSNDYEDLLSTLKIKHSYSKKGYPYDNASMESFNAILKKEEVNNNTYERFEGAKLVIFEFIESWYINPHT